MIERCRQIALLGQFLMNFEYKSEKPLMQILFPNLWEKTKNSEVF